MKLMQLFGVCYYSYYYQSNVQLNYDQFSYYDVTMSHLMIYQTLALHMVLNLGFEMLMPESQLLKLWDLIFIKNYGWHADVLE